MWKKLSSIIQSPKQRTQIEVIGSGALIAVGLIARTIFQLESMYAAAMIAASVVAGSDIAVRAFISLRNRHISIELLVTIATIGALAIGEVWEAAAVTFLFVLGAYLEVRTLAQTRKVLADLFDLAPVTAVVLREGRQEEVAAHEVLVGEVVLLKPGVKVPVDGEIIAGASAVDESMITGEPMPEEKTQGAQVFAGSVNLDGMLQVRATGTGTDTTLARIIARVEEAQEEKAPIQRFVEKFSQWYTPAIILLSVMVYLVSRNVELALTLLVIGCPGALVISTPVSVIAGIGQGARRGILIKGGEYLENAGRITALALDKTGTITYGKPHLTDIWVLESVRSPLQAETLTAQGRLSSEDRMHWSADQQEVLFWAGVAENVSEHPLAQAITKQAQKIADLPVPEQFTALPGKGIEAAYQGRSILVGKPDWLLEQGVNLPVEAHEEILRLREVGKTVVVVALDGAAAGILGIADRIRPDAAAMLARARAGGVSKIIMLTGDDERTARAVAQEAGIEDMRSNLLPEDKLQAIRELQQKGYVVAMVGDGINDAPALAAADVGIAMGAAGSGVAIETADIALMADDLSKVSEAIHLSKATVRNIHQNLAIALVTVAILLTGVLLDKVHMAGGMLVHQVSVLVVIFNGMRLLRT